MVGKMLMAVLLALAGLSAAGCAFFADPGEPNNGFSSPEETENGTSFDCNEAGSGSSDGTAEETLKLKPAGDPLAYFGRSMDEIKAVLGEPGDQGFFQGAEYFFYRDVGLALFFWSASGEENLVRSIQLSKGGELAGIRVGMTFAEIKAILGAPVYEGYSEYEENYALVCDYGQYRLFFSADTIDGPTTTVRVKYIQDS